MNISISKQTQPVPMSEVKSPSIQAKAAAAGELKSGVLGADTGDKIDLKATAAGALVGAAAVYIPIVGFANVMKPWIGGSFAETLIMPFQDRGLANAMGVGAMVGGFAGAAAGSHADSVGEGALQGGGVGLAAGAFTGGVVGAFLEGRPSLAGALHGAVRGALAGAVVGAAGGAAGAAVKSK